MAPENPGGPLPVHPDAALGTELPPAMVGRADEVIE
jgi:hypothetical protein